MADNKRLKLKKKANKFSNSGSSDEVIKIQDSPEKVSGIQDPQTTSPSIKSPVYSSDGNASAGFPSPGKSKSSVRLSSTTTTSVASATKVHDVKNEAKRIQSSLISKALQKTNGYKPLPVRSKKVMQANEESYKKLPTLCKKCQSLSFPRGINWNFKELFLKAPSDTKLSGGSINQSSSNVSEQIRDYNFDSNFEKTEISLQKQQRKYNWKSNQHSDDLTSFPANEMQYITAASSNPHSLPKGSAREVVYKCTISTSNQNFNTDDLRQDKTVVDQMIIKTESCSKDRKNDDDYCDIDLEDFDDSEMDVFLLDFPDESGTNCHKATLPSTKESKLFDNDSRKEFPTHHIQNSKKKTQTSNVLKRPGISDSVPKKKVSDFKKSFQDTQVDEHSDIHPSRYNSYFKPQNENRKILKKYSTQSFKMPSQTSQNDQKLHNKQGLFRKEPDVHSSGNSSRFKPKNDSEKNYKKDGGSDHHNLGFKGTVESARNSETDFGIGTKSVVGHASLKRKLDVVILDDAEEKSTSDSRSNFVPNSKSARIQSTIRNFHNPSNTSFFSCPSKGLAQQNPAKLSRTSKDSFSTHRTHNGPSNLNSANFSSSAASNSSSASAKPTASALSPAKCPICQLKFPDWWKELQRNQHASKCLSDSFFKDDEDDELFGEIDLDC